MENNNKPKSNASDLFEGLMISNKNLHLRLSEFSDQINSYSSEIKNEQLMMNSIAGAFTNLKKAMIKEKEVRELFISQIPTNIEASLSNETLQIVDKIDRNSRVIKYFLQILLISSLLSFLSLFIAGNLVKTWYAEGVRSKTELRQEIFDNIKSENKVITEKQYLKNLEENTSVMQIWIKNNPKDSEKFLRFKDGYEAKKNQD